MQPGDHIYVRRRTGYTHHGIFVSVDEVIHFAGTTGQLKQGAAICVCTLDDFASGGRVQVRVYGNRLSADETIERARARVGESGYHLLGNNCEHMACWCVTGRTTSRQVNGAAATGAVGVIPGVGAAAGVGTVATVGTVGGLSGSGIMSGLAGSAVVGSGAVGGLVTLGLAPGVMSAGVMQVALRDDESLPDDEREARQAGRVASVAGVAAGSAGAITAVSAAGFTGLSAAGITSGLATIGASVGGGMAAGSAIVIAAPAVAAAGAGYAVYRGMRAFKRWNRDRLRSVDPPADEPAP
jgi:hypothetical protein